MKTMILLFLLVASCSADTSGENPVSDNINNTNPNTTNSANNAVANNTNNVANNASDTGGLDMAQDQAGDGVDPDVDMGPPKPIILAKTIESCGPTS